MNWQLLLYFGGAVAGYYVWVTFYRLYLHPLAHFPGPKLAAISRWYEAYYDVVQGGQYTFKIAELHKEYGTSPPRRLTLPRSHFGANGVFPSPAGPIVRISPHELHVSDPTFYPIIYRTDGQWEKYEWSYNAMGAPYAAICTMNHDMHKRRRAAIDPLFSKAKINASQDMLQKYVRKLSDRMDEYVTSGSVLNLGVAFNALTGDFVTEYLLGKSYDSLDMEDFNQGMVECIQGSGAIWRLTKHVPWLRHVFLNMPMWLIERSGSGPQVTAFKAFQEASSMGCAKAIPFPMLT